VPGGRGGGDGGSVGGGGAGRDGRGRRRECGMGRAPRVWVGPYPDGYVRGTEFLAPWAGVRRGMLGRGRVAVLGDGKFARGSVSALTRKRVEQEAWTIRISTYLYVPPKCLELI